MTKTAIIGSTSFLASYIIVDLERENHELTLLSRASSTANHSFITFSYPDSVPSYSIFLEYDVIIFAAAAGVQSSKKYNIDEIYGLNAFLPIALSNFLQENNFKGKFITFGSYFEIGSQEELLHFTETDLTLSNFKVPNHYCLSKRLLTRYVNSSMSAINHYHIILPSIYGRNENGSRLIPYLISSLQNQKELELTACTQIRQFLHAKDVSDFILMVCKEFIESGVYNLATHEYYMVRDVVEIVYDYLGKDCSMAFGKIHRNDESMKVLLLDSTKSRVAGWQSKVNLKEGILDYFIN